MKLTKEQCQQLLDQVSDNPAEIKKTAHEMGIDLSDELAEKFREKAREGKKEVSDEELDSVVGGIELGEDIPNLDVIREYYDEKGPNLAFILCIYYIPSPSCFDIIKLIEEEIKNEKH